MPISEQVELLGKGLYQGVPDVLTLKSIPTASELDYVSREDFEKTMLEVILPSAVEESVDFHQLLEIDYTWVCRCLRILNYGPYHTTNAIFCTECGTTSRGEYQVDLRSIEVKTLPNGFKNDIVIESNDLIDFSGDIHISLPTIQQMINASKDKAFQDSKGRPNMNLARMCYMIREIDGRKSMTPIEIKLFIQKNLSSADYQVLASRITELTDYGLRAGGVGQCPKCGNTHAAFIAMVDDRFFRPSVGDLRRWKHDRSSGADENVSGGSSKTV